MQTVRLCIVLLIFMKLLSLERSHVRWQVCHSFFWLACHVFTSTSLTSCFCLHIRSWQCIMQMISHSHSYLSKHMPPIVLPLEHFFVFSALRLIIVTVRKWSIFALRSWHEVCRHGDSCLAASASYRHHCNEECWGNRKVRKGERWGSTKNR